ncbi:MAG: molybdopterin-dependent oxidoreductase, partial [Anaerolineae bacterium]|nr:molybdopterin-dependent oxidoreductase [Anaerolineae bacterium]
YYADVVLPAASFYEKWDLNSTDLHSYIHPFTPAISPRYESKTDWQIWVELAQALQNTGYSYYDSKFGITRDFSTLVSDFTDGAALSQDKDACQYLLDHAEETQGVTMDQLDSQPHRFTQTSDFWTSDIFAEEAYYGFQRMHDYLRPLTTLTGRQQFYIDQDWFMEMGEELPAQKGPVNSDAYPLRWITPHGRWSIHSTWRDAKFQLRLQRGRPVVYLSPNEAAARGLSDNDEVEVYNGNGGFVAHL